MLGQRLVTEQTDADGLPVDKLYVMRKSDVVRKYQLVITVDRSLSCPILVISQDTHLDVKKKLAAKDLTSTATFPLRYSRGITDEVITALMVKLGLNQTAEANMSEVVRGLYAFFKSSDATRVEIDPLIIDLRTGLYLSAGSRVSIDDAAAKRQEALFDLRDTTQEGFVELEAQKHGLVYVQLDGNIGCLVNGAGLAMATNDAVAHYGGRCANFLDGGGQATKKTMVKAFDLILSDKRVNTIIVDIYGGLPIPMLFLDVHVHFVRLTDFLKASYAVI